jgi:hypothetical protein
MTFNSLNTIIDDIMLELRNSNISESEQLSRIQIEQWIHNYRAMLIKQDIDKGRDINPAYIQSKTLTLENSTSPYSSTTTLPKTIDFHFKPGIVSVRDNTGKLIQVGSRLKAELQPIRQYAIYDPIAYIQNDYLKLMDGRTVPATSLTVDIIAEDPTSIDGTYNYDGQYPCPANMIPTIKDLIFTKELYIMPQETVDTTNDSDDDTQNKVSTRSLRKAK